MPQFTLIQTPDEVEAAWAEHADRQRIIDAYSAARTKSEAAAARWDAIAYDQANPHASSLVAELDDSHATAAAA